MQTPEDRSESLRQAVVHAALPHVPFDGWSGATFQLAVQESGVNAILARALFPRGGLDLARAYHLAGDREMARLLAERDQTGLRFRDRVTLAVRLRLEGLDPEIVRRGMTLFALPQHAAEGASLIWQTADAIWNALQDNSRDVNWYTKRASLSAVYSATILFWLADGSLAKEDTWHFLDRRIEDVMRFEKVKAQMRGNAVFKAVFSGPMKIMERVYAPKPQDDLPGRTEA